MNKKELLREFPQSYIYHDLIKDIYYICLFNDDNSTLVEIKINYKDYNEIERITKLMNFNTKKYKNIIFKAYNEQNREEILKKWRVSRLRAKLAVKEEIKPRRKI